MDADIGHAALTARFPCVSTAGKATKASSQPLVAEENTVFTVKSNADEPCVLQNKQFSQHEKDDKHQKHRAKWGVYAYIYMYISHTIHSSLVIQSSGFVLNDPGARFE